MNLSAIVGWEGESAAHQSQSGNTMWFWCQGFGNLHINYLFKTGTTVKTCLLLPTLSMWHFRPSASRKKHTVLYFCTCGWHVTHQIRLEICGVWPLLQIPKVLFQRLLAMRLYFLVLCYPSTKYLWRKSLKSIYLNIKMILLTRKSSSGKFFRKFGMNKDRRHNMVRYWS